MASLTPPRVVIVGAGFGGLPTARGLAGREVEVVVVDRGDYHGFWPLLYQVATAGLAPDDIARPVRAELAGAGNVTVRMATVAGFDLDARLVHLADQEDLAYDFLVVAAGSTGTDLGIAGVSRWALPLKTLPDAVRLRNHLLTTFERAADAVDAGTATAAGAKTVVLVGGGPSGVEMAGALSELIAHNLSHDFPHLDMAEAQVVLVEATDRLLPGFSDAAAGAADRSLAAKGVDLRLGTALRSVTEHGVTLDDGSTLEAATVVWTAGVAANPVAGLLPSPQTKGGRVVVGSDLSLPGHRDVLVIGDLAGSVDRDGAPLPQVAQVAIQGGRHAARCILRRNNGKHTRAFRYRDHGMMATIGRRSAVADLPGGLHLQGTPGWLAWLGVHLVFLVGFRNRVTVLASWAVNYLTWERASRIILDDAGPFGLPAPDQQAPPSA